MTQTVENHAGLELLLDTLCPLHIILDHAGRIFRIGPAVRKLLEGRPWEGEPLLDVFELRRPKTLHGMDGLMEQSGRKLHFAINDRFGTQLKGVVVPLPEGSIAGLERGAVLNLSFGISVVDAVRDYALTGADFAVTDLTVEMLYLVEAKSAVMEELRHLNTRLQGARIEAEQQAVTDLLTGLGNRRAMDHALGQLLAQKKGFTMMHVDLDHFKAVNDSFGHAAGDAVLQGVADRLRSVTRSGDTVVRQGGDEFVLVLPGLVDEPLVSGLAQRLVQEIEKPVFFGNDALRVSASIGISTTMNARTADPDRMMEEADTALYVVKSMGRHGFKIYAPEMGRMGSEQKRGDAA